MTAKKVLLTPSSFGQCGAEPIELLEKEGFTVVNNPYGRKVTTSELLELAGDCVGVVAGVEDYTPEVFEKLPGLKVVSRCGVGMDSVDLDAAKKNDVLVCNTPNGPVEPVAELTLGLILSVLRGIARVDAQLKQGQWKKFNGWLLNDKTVGLVGFGRIGRRVAELLRPFSVKLCILDPGVTTEQAQELNVTKCDDMSQFLKKADIVSLHLNWDKKNGFLIGENEISQMKSGAFLINMSRGGAVDEKALFQALKNEHLAGAATDVYEQEPYSGELSSLPNLVMTPHIGSYAREAKLKMEVQAVNNLIHALT